MSPINPAAGETAAAAGACSAATATLDTQTARLARGADTRPGSPASVSPVLALSAAEVRGPRGTVFGPLTAESAAPVTAILGARGSGRTSLLLALGGRMRLSAGELTLLGRTSPGELGALRRATGLVGFTGIDELEAAVTVGATLRERLAWASPWYRRSPRITDELSRELLAPTFGAGGPGERNDARAAIPSRGALVRDLTQAQNRLLRVALARIERPELLLVDDFDDIRDPAERRMVAERLRVLATEQGVHSVVVTADERDLDLLGAHAPILLASH